MIDFRPAQFGARLNQVIFLNFALLMEVEVLKELLHLLKEATIHEDGTDTAQELIEVDVLLATLIKQ